MEKNSQPTWEPAVHHIHPVLSSKERTVIAEIIAKIIKDAAGIKDE